MKKSTIHFLTKLGFAVVAVLTASSASAVLYSWTLAGTGASFNAGTAGGVTLIAKAYSSNVGGTDVGVRNASSWVAGTFGNYDPSGVGITNIGEAGAGSPNHAVDNGGRLDVVVLEASTAVDWKSVTANWVNNATTNIQAWTGGTVGANFNFTNVCFSGNCSIGGAGNTLASLGFSSAGSFGTVGVGVAQNLTDGSAPSRYLIVAGNLGQFDDAFKLRTIAAAGVVPEPASIALLGLGLVAFGFARRKRTS